jgi:hypothetical protein
MWRHYLVYRDLATRHFVAVALYFGRAGFREDLSIGR